MIKLNFIFFLLLCCFGCSEDFRVVPEGNVYAIIEKEGSIYFSTSRGKIFSFPLGEPGEVKQIAGCGKTPFRSIAFTGAGKLLAASYEAGLHVVREDTLLPVGNGIAPAWSMKLKSDSTIWLAGTHGVFKGRENKFEKVFSSPKVHDIAFWNKQAVLALYDGLGFMDINTGDGIRKIYPGVNFWRVRTFGTVLVAGGKNLCVLIKPGGLIKEIKIPGKNNIVWDVALDKKGRLYLASQEGLLAAESNKSEAQFLTEEGKCVKTVFIDSHNQVWIGMF